MPSSLATGPKGRPMKSKFRDALMVPDFIVTSPVLAAASFGGANTGATLFVVPAGLRAVFLGATEVHTTAGNNPLRIKKVVAGQTDAIGSAADADNVNLTAEFVTTTAANTPLNVAPSDAKGWAVLEAGDRIGVAANLQVTSLAGCVIQLRLAWI